MTLWRAGLQFGAAKLPTRPDGVATLDNLVKQAPVRRGNHMELPDFPKIESPADVPKAQAAILSAVAAGHLTAEEAKPLSDLLAAYITAFDVIDTAAEVAEIKRMQQEATQR